MNNGKVYKYLNANIDISYENEIFLPDNVYWKNKLLVFTKHFKLEFRELRKPTEFILEILEKGKHVLVSKRQNKYNVFYQYQQKYLCLSYAEYDYIVLIHIKPTKVIK